MQYASLKIQLLFGRWFFVCLPLVAGLVAPEESRLVAEEREHGVIARQSGKIDFARDIIPLLTKAGCNSGACHGAAAGRGYLSLSLFGARPDDDFETLLHRFPGRFIDLEAPGDSRLLQKPSGFLQHTGGVRFEEASREFQQLKQWVEQRVPFQTNEISAASTNDSTQAKEDIARPARLIVSSATLDGTASQRLETDVRVEWNDGMVTPAVPWLLVDGASEVKPEAKNAGEATGGIEWSFCDGEFSRIAFTANSPGYWPITLRYGPVVSTVQVWIRPGTVGVNKNLQLPSDSVAQQSIDHHVQTAVARLGIELAGACEPHELVRRLWIDLTGRHPSPEEWSEGVERVRGGEKVAMILELIDSREFADRAADEIVGWSAAASSNAMVISQLQAAVADYLQNGGDDLRELAKRMLWVDEQSNVPEPLAAFHLLAADPRQRAEVIASTWLGVRVGCAKCHDHPLDHWTQDDYFSMAACWAEVEPRPQTGAQRIPGRTTTDLRTGKPAVARLPFAAEPYLASSQRAGSLQKESADQAFVDWLCDAENELFAKNLANRTWRWLMGIGLIEEVDDQRATNPAINPELLVCLVSLLKENDFSLRRMVAAIVSSDAYARQSSTSARQIAWQLTAIRTVKDINQPLDQLAEQTLFQGPANAQALVSAGASAMISAPTDDICTRGEACGDPLGESLQLIAGKGLNEVIHSAVEMRLEISDSPVEVLKRLYFDLFGRQPSDALESEWQSWLDAETHRAEQVAIVEDVLWSWLVDDRFRRLH